MLADVCRSESATGQPRLVVPPADSNARSQEGAEVEKDVTMSETTAEIKMGATASND